MSSPKETMEEDVVEQPAKVPAKRGKIQPVMPAQLTLGRKNDLVKMLKQMEKLTPSAVKVMVAALEDENTDVKIRVDIAKTLLDTRIKLSESISRDNLQRTMGEHRMRLAENPVKKIVDVEDEGTVAPIFRPDVILSVDATNI